MVDFFTIDMISREKEIETEHTENLSNLSLAEAAKENKTKRRTKMGNQSKWTTQPINKFNVGEKINT